MGDSLGCVSRDEDADKDVPLKHVPHYPPPDDTDIVDSFSPPQSSVIAVDCAQPGAQRPQSDALAGWNVSSQTVAASSSSARWTNNARAAARQQSVAALDRLRIGNVKFLSGATKAFTTNSHAEDGSGRPQVIVSCCTPPPAPLEIIFGVSGQEISCTASSSLDDSLGDDGGAAAMELSMSLHSSATLMLVMDTLAPDEDPEERKSVIWSAIEKLLKHSQPIREALRKGAVYLNGAMLELSTGQVHFLGEHADQASLMASPRRNRSKEVSETSTRPVVPADEALAMLMCGNLRAQSLETSHESAPRSGRRMISDSHNDPIAVVFTDFDPHHGEGSFVENIFDTPANHIATIPVPTVNVSDESYWDIHLHLADYCLVERSARLLLVLALAPPKATDDELEQTKAKVFHDMMNIMRTSKLIRAGIIDGRLQMHGGIYDGSIEGHCGMVEWLGTHPDQGEELKKALQISSSTSGLIPGADADDDAVSSSLVMQEVLQLLQAGNKRHLQSGPAPYTRWLPEMLKNYAGRDACPNALVLTGANWGVRSPEYLFDAGPGELLVHRTCGNISGRRGGSALNTLERLVTGHPEITVLVVLGDVCDPAMKDAVMQVQSLTNTLRPENAQAAIDQLAPAAIQALRKFSPEMMSDGTSDDDHQNELIGLATEFHLGYVAERILLDSDPIFERVRAGSLQVHRAIAHCDSSVTFLGHHPDLPRVSEQRARIERHRRKGLKLGPKNPAAK